MFDSYFPTIFLNDPSNLNHLLLLIYMIQSPYGNDSLILIIEVFIYPLHLIMIYFRTDVRKVLYLISTRTKYCTMALLDFLLTVSKYVH